MRRSRKKFSIYSASPGLENTEKYGTRKYSSKKKKELENLETKDCGKPFYQWVLMSCLRRCGFLRKA